MYCSVCTYFLYDVRRRRGAAVLPALLLRACNRAARYSEGSLREGHVSAAPSVGFIAIISHVFHINHFYICIVILYVLYRHSRVHLMIAVFYSMIVLGSALSVVALAALALS